MIRYFTILILSLSGFAAMTQQYHFRNFSLEEGLSQSVVNCVFQDSRGYLWVGTQNGLNRFNGYDFTVFLYNPDDTNSISNNWIYSITEDRSGNLWIGTKQGLNRYNRAKNNFRRISYSSGFKETISPCVYDVLVASSGNIYLNTPPVLTLYQPGTGRLAWFPTNFPYTGLVEDNRIPLMEDQDGDIWVGSNSGLACFRPVRGTFSYYLTTGKTKDLTGSRVTSLGLDTTGIVWIGTANGIKLLSKKDGSISNLLYSDQGQRLFGNTFIRAIIPDPSGAMWIGTEGNGLSRISRLDPETFLLDTYNSATHGLGHNIVLSLTIDRSRNLWAGTLQGLSKTDLKPFRFKLYRRDNTTSSVNLMGNVVASIYKAPDGKIWVGNWGQGLNILDRQTGQVTHYSSRERGNNYIPNDFVHVIFADEEKNVWIGTRDGIFVFDAIQKRFVRFNDFFPQSKLPDLQGTRIFMIIQAKDKSYWISTQSGLFNLHLHKTRIKLFSAESTGDFNIGSNMVYCIYEDHLGYIWLATINGLDVFNPYLQKMTRFRKNETQNSLCDNFVISLCEDKSGDMWIGTGAFVNKFVRKDSTFIYFNKEDGLMNNNVFEILRDEQNTLWFATGGGLSRYDSITGKFRTYSVDDGLQSPEFNLRACYKSQDGEIFFGGMNGFNSFYPGKLEDNPYIPEIVITSCYKSTLEGKEIIPVNQENSVTMNYGDQEFTVEFVGIEFTNPAKNQYAYMIEGVSANWINIGNRRFVPFSNLSPGEYILRIKGSNNDGRWNESGTTLRIIILPPWWRSTFAWIAYILILIFILLILVRWREKRLKAERDLLEKKVHERTLQIEHKNDEILQKNDTLNQLNEELRALNNTKDKFFSIIAHDLRNPFNSIIGLTDIVLGNLTEPGHEKSRKTVIDIREASRHAFDLLQNLLIWARSQTGNLEFNPTTFDLTERIDDNIILVQGQAARKNIILLNHSDNPVVITGDIQMINTILRNLLTNAIKFTPHEGKVEVYVSRENGSVIITVCDNGVGITPEIMGKIFRLDNKYTHKGTDHERGSGLGLILCKEFAEKHSGTISVESEPGKGSCFYVRLPEIQKQVT